MFQLKKKLSIRMYSVAIGTPVLGYDGQKSLDSTPTTQKEAN